MMSVGNLVLRRGFYSAGPNAVCGPRQTQSYNDFKIPSLDYGNPVQYQNLNTTKLLSDGVYV